jgi:glycosyltransferase involved in cell wall biosynthesis
MRHCCARSHHDPPSENNDKSHVLFSRYLGRKARIAYLVTHPIQYQAPLLRLISEQPDIDLTVFFQSDLSSGSYFDSGFGRQIEWDVPLLEGYRSEFLPSFGRRDKVTLTKPYSHGFGARLKRGKFDVLWVHGYARPFNWAAIVAARAASIPVLVRDEASAKSAPRGAAKMVLKRIFFRALAALCYGFLAIGTLNRRYYVQNGVKPQRTFLVPYCVDNKYFAERAFAASQRREAFRAEIGLEPGRPIILYASKFLARKRPGDLLAAFARLVDKRSGSDVPYLVFVGDGELRAALQRQAEPIKQHVRFMGFRNQSELPAFFGLCDVFVLPSEAEPWGLIVNEVMSAGRAVIVSDLVGCGPDLVRHGVNGCIFPAGDVAKLEDSLARVLVSRDVSTEMGRASAAIIATWSYQQDIDGLREALSAVLRSAGKLP